MVSKAHTGHQANLKDVGLWLDSRVRTQESGQFLRVFGLAAGQLVWGVVTGIFEILDPPGNQWYCTSMTPQLDGYFSLPYS